MENFGRGRGSSGGRGRGRNNRLNFGIGRGRDASGCSGGRAGGVGRANSEHHVPSQPRVSEVACDALVPDLHSLNISQTPLPSRPPEVGERIQAKRPDNGGEASIRPVCLLVNHFPIHFNSERTIFHYDIDIKPEVPPKHGGTVRLPCEILQGMIDMNCIVEVSDRVAYHGQQYHEALMESRERDSTSSLSEDMLFVLLHNDLEKFMVFLCR